ncbi:tol-pal system-associated acyl-CoA thioesterase [Brevundimonas sp.]|uniref:tol-pal system-associated acyl-CoA thioesterase n=1 Tax=Brevundimonas sp. TaxID=1871086 RepID=UPI0025FDEC2B|nr:tol-pal system-associated acyl-CoA thioesterase [Brevundimonas sp.]
MTEPTAGAFDGRTHLLPVRVYYEDTDFTGLVYHANYLRYFERGRSDFLRLVSSGHAELLERDDPMAFVVTRMDIRFLKAARIDDALVVRTAYEAIKGPRLIIRQSITRGDQTLCEADVEAACIDLNGRPRRPPRAMAEALGPWLRDKAAD